MRKTIYVLVISAFLFSCSSNKTTEVETTKDTVQSQTPSTPEVGKKYSIKSGMIRFKTEVMGIQQETIDYFDDFGDTEVIISKIEILKGQITETRSIIKDGFMTELDMSKKTGTKRKMAVNANSAGIDFANLTDEIMGEMNLKNEGKVTFLGKPCDKFSIDFKKQQLKGTYVVWQNIPLKTDVMLQGMPMKIEATEIQENTSIPADLIEVPKGFKIKEY